ncbi:hypothetical protein [Oceanomicrobium pacificus]|uniref:Long-chain fatty acid transport protein n=1 Tax=Oceanomicrobium pacificus TaxID=2692916 RepID=A0A6B0U744_9RHOB|nr:hypothetical protein [Oceanomicrobium pacificus]MXU66681.1 hypothetical protein [Oceanomicrobium pacificus]
MRIDAGPVLLLSMILVAGAPAPAQDQPNLSVTAMPQGRLLGAGGGVAIGSYGLPDWTVWDGSPEGGTADLGVQLIGPQFGIGLASRPFELGGRTYYMEYEGNFAFGAGSSSATTRYSNDSGLSFGTGASSDFTIDLQTSADGSGATASGDASILDLAGGTATISSLASSLPGLGNAITQFAFSPTTTGTGGIFVGLVTDGADPASSAFGLAFDRSGYSAVGVGDLSQTTFTAKLEEDMFLTRHQVTLAAPLEIGGDWQMTYRAGPVYRYLKRDTTITSSVATRSPDPDVAPLPVFGARETSDMRAHYLGAIVGAGVSRSIRDNWNLRFALDAGLSAYRASYDGQTNFLLGTQDSGESMSMSDDVNGTAYHGRLTGSLSYNLRPGIILSLDLHADYLSDVPYIQTDVSGGTGASFSPDGRQVQSTGTGSTRATNRFGTTSMTSYGAGISFVKLF